MDERRKRCLYVLRDRHIFVKRIWQNNCMKRVLYKCGMLFWFQFGVAVAWLSCFDVILLILLIPVMDKFFYPWIRRQGWKFTTITRIRIGFCYAVAAMVCAGVVEYYRRQSFYDYSPVNNNSTECCVNVIPQQFGETFLLLWIT